MAEQEVAVKTNTRGCLQHNWVEERAVAALGIEESRNTIRKCGNKGIITMDLNCKMETLSTSKATYVPPVGPGVRLSGAGMKRDLLEKHFCQMIQEKIQAEMSSPASEADYKSTSQRDFCVPGFVPSRPKPTQDHDYKNEQAITFWSENCQRIQRVSPIRNPNAPFRKSALFSTPITERLDEEDLPPDN
ncbi:sperm-associated antigen 8 [Anableps anableps]